MEISKSDVVISTAGRDRGKLFYVIDTDGIYLTLANGKERKLEKPKQKKLKHVRKVARSRTRVAEKICSGERVLNSELRRDLAAFSQNNNSHNQGGMETWQRTT